MTTKFFQADALMNLTSAMTGNQTYDNVSLKIISKLINIASRIAVAQECVDKNGHIEVDCYTKPVDRIAEIRDPEVQKKELERLSPIFVNSLIGEFKIIAEYYGFDRRDIITYKFSAENEVRYAEGISAAQEFLAIIKQKLK